MKLLLTGDNHFGKKYDRYPEIREQLIQSRFDCFQDLVRKAEEEECDFFVVAGDLFDNTRSVRVSDVKKAVGILSEFSGSVLVLPGNHDYYNGEEKVWRDFEKALNDCDHNISLLKEFREYTFDINDEKVVIYPAFCQSKHASGNNLGWIKTAAVDRNAINIGIAHGALQGITPDLKNEYFLMTETELRNIPMDLWLLGHTHIPYPGDLDTLKESSGCQIFNAGTHEQTDLSNNTEGNAFIITAEKEKGKASVSARKVISGKIRYYDISVHADVSRGQSLADLLKQAADPFQGSSVIRVKLSGTVRKQDYLEKEKICRDVLGEGFLSYEVDDYELSEEITRETIQSEFAETSFAARFLEKLLEDPRELQMAYELIQECKTS